jgi:membrane-associated phospholipid phosphatase
MRTAFLLSSHVGAVPAPVSRQGRAVREVAILSAGAVGYFGGRLVVEGTRGTAIRNAERLLELERDLGIDIEHDLQRLTVDNDLLRFLGNASYVWLHWPLLIAVLWFLFHRDSSRYRPLRNAMFLSGAIGLLFFALLPMAPPRFMPGFEGTVSDAARRHYLAYPLSWTNPFAAFPSFHAGWTLIACIALSSTMRTTITKAVALVPAALVMVAVVSTGNHYVLDTLTGVVIALACYAWFTSHARGQDVGDMEPG